MSHYPSLNLYQEIEKDYDCPIICPLENSDLVNDNAKYLCVADFIFCGPIYISFSEDISEDINIINQFNYLAFNIYITDNDYYPNEVSLTLLGSFNVADNFSNPASYEIKDMKANRLLAINLEEAVYNDLAANNPIQVDYQIKVEVVIVGNPVYNGSVSFHFYQFIKDLM